MTQFASQPSQNFIDYQALRSQVPIRRVLEIAGWEPVSQQGTQLRGPCPVHKSESERSRSLSVSSDKNIYQCFGCGSKGNQLDLASAIFGVELYQAAVQLCEQLGIEPPRREA